MNTLDLYLSYSHLYDAATDLGVPREFSMERTGVYSAGHEEVKFNYSYWEEGKRVTDSVKSLINPVRIEWMEPDTVYKLSDIEGYEEHHNRLMKEQLQDLTHEVFAQIMEELENPEKADHYYINHDLLMIDASGANKYNVLICDLLYAPPNDLVGRLHEWNIDGIQCDPENIPYGRFRVSDLREHIEAHTPLNERLKRTGEHYRELLNEYTKL